MSFDQRLRKNFWVAPLLLVAIAALCAAVAVGQLIGIGLLPDPKELAVAPRAAPQSSAQAARAVSAKSILERNPFDHVTGSLTPAPSSPEAATGAPVDLSPDDPFAVPECDGVDVGPIIASDDHDWSIASVSGADKKARLVRRGAEVSGKRVHFIGWDRLWLASDSGLCQAKVFAGKKAPAAPPPAPSASTPAPASSRSAPTLAPDLKKGIRAVSATEFEIDRGVVDKIIENQAELMRQARILPVQENGRTVGVKMMGIRPDTLLGVLGMQNNDRLDKINGFDMGSPEKALEAYARLRTADKLTIQIQRGGKSMNLDYNIK